MTAHMSGNLVNVTSLDSVRIEVVGEGRAVTIPAALILAADRVLRHCLLNEFSLEIDMVDPEPDGKGWEASTDGTQDACAHGETPWAALLALADNVGNVR